MDRNTAISKIRKCLALARSGNPHEAATALRQAQKLMQEYQIDHDDMAAADVAEAPAAARTARMVTWEVSLATLVAETFGCEFFGRTHFLPRDRTGFSRRKLDYVFVGQGAAAEVAAYAYDVLARQCSALRLRHIKCQPKNCKAATKTARGDMFALGFVQGAAELVQRLAVTEDHSRAIQHWLAAHYPDMHQGKAQNRTRGRNVRDDDALIGLYAGRKAKLERGIGGGLSPALLN